MNFNAELQALFTLQGLTNLVILSLLELVLGIDNIIFISLVITKLPEEERLKARVTGLSLAFIMRVIMLFGIVWLSRITKPLFTISHVEVSIRDILFFNGGLYLVVSTLKEIAGFFKIKKTNNLIRTGASARINNSDGKGEGHQPITKGAISFEKESYKSVVVLIVMIDMLFSFDSIFTAIGLISNFIIMALAIGCGTVFMIYISGETSGLMEKYPSLKIMALYFIMIVGLSLLAKSFHIEIPKIYFFGALALIVMLKGFRRRRRSH